MGDFGYIFGYCLIFAFSIGLLTGYGVKAFIDKHKEE
jgi:hypothetical protein